MSASIRATFRNPRTNEYAAPGGPWYGADLPSLLLALPSLTTLVCAPDGRLGTDDLLDAVRHTAGWLRARGVERRDAVAWQLPNGADVVVLYLATWWLGAVAVPFHEGVTAHEAGAVLEEIGGARVLLVGPDVPVAALDGAIIVADGTLRAITRAEPVESPASHPEDPAVLLTTSGSSGNPKTVVHSQRSLAHKARQMTVLHGTTSDDAVLVPAPLSHMAGVLHAVMHPIGTGVKAVLMAKWDAEEALELVRRERVTMLFGPPIFALGIASAAGFSPDAVRSVRLVSSGATAISEAYVHQVEELYGATVKRTYGSTEAPIACTTLPGDEPSRGWTTDGRPVPGVELELRDPDDGTVLIDGGPGEIWLRGPELCDGYLDPEQTATTFVDGWMRTRDLGRFDDEGFLTVVGRISDFIIRGGMNISAREVEDALEQHPSVAQAVVLGYSDDVYGERVAAFVVSDTALDRDECVRWFAEVGVAKYKVPDRVVRLDEMPVLSTYQKPDVGALRDLL